MPFPVNVNKSQAIRAIRIDIFVIPVFRFIDRSHKVNERVVFCNHSKFVRDKHSEIRLYSSMCQILVYCRCRIRWFFSFVVFALWRGN